MQTLEPVRARTIHARLVAFFLASYAFTWFGHLGHLLLPSDAWPRPMFPWGPLIAAILVITVTEGRAGLRAWWVRVRVVRAPAGVYAAATLGPLGIVVASAALSVLAGADIDTATWTALPMVLLGIPLIVVLGGPGTEEPAFRGYGQHDLQQTISPLVASLWIGMGVLLWHLPVLLGGNIPWPIAVALPAVSVVYAWLYRAGGSVWPLVALHTVINAISGEYVGGMIGSDDEVVYTGFLAAGFVAWAVLLVARLGPSLGGTSPVAALPPQAHPRA